VSSAMATDCPGRHGLVEVPVTRRDWICDLCSEKIVEGETAFGCRQCDFDACATCFEKDDVAKADTFRKRLRRYSRQVRVYADPAKHKCALSVLPQILLESTHNEDCYVELLRWFKSSFFTWTDKPPCSCGAKAGQKQGMVEPSADDLCKGATRVESWKCECGELVRFPRYSDPVHLLKTRHGRCGEWANCFTLCAAAVGFEVRLVVDWTDHVWTEVFLGGRWVHSDPCEACFDAPLTYEVGWGKKLTYVIAFSPTEVIDVTPRYTGSWMKVLQRRNLVSEERLALVVAEVDNAVRLPSWREEEMTVLEGRKSAVVLQVSSAERCGRTTGSLEWRQARGEVGTLGQAPLSIQTSPPAFGFLGVSTSSVDSTSVAQLLGGAALASFHGVDCLDLAEGALEADVPDAVACDAFQSPDGFTVEVWVMTSAPLHRDAHMNPIVSKHGPSTGWELRLQRDGGAVFLVTVGGQHYEVACVGPPWDSWVHVAGTFDGSSVRVFVAGQTGERQVPNGERSSFDGPVCVGVNPAWRDRTTSCRVHAFRVALAVLTERTFLSKPHGCV